MENSVRVCCKRKAAKEGKRKDQSKHFMKEEGPE